MAGANSGVQLNGREIPRRTLDEDGTRIRLIEVTVVVTLVSGYNLTAVKTVEMWPLAISRPAA